MLDRDPSNRVVFSWLLALTALMALVVFTAREIAWRS